MTWSKDDEELLQQLTLRKREEHAETRSLAAIEEFRALANRLEAKEVADHRISLEYLYREYPGMTHRGPPYATRITIEIPIKG